MTLTIELTPEQEEALRMIASATGMEPGEYVKQALVGEDLQLTEEEELALMATLEDMKETNAKIIGHLEKINTVQKEMIGILREGR